MSTTYSTADRHASLRVWLAALAAMIALTAIVGAATRLTGSGLSITEWAPIMGVVPPLSDADWQAAFGKYQAIPQYKLINKGMALADFKSIFWWEWSHRILARALGIVFLVPFAVLLLRRAIPARLVPFLLGIFALGALQGFIGWYMVSSGLVERVDVSQYRLALHLGLAVAIFGLIVAMFTRLSAGSGEIHLSTLTASDRRAAFALVFLIYVQVVLGALVAGLKAGRTYNTWPLMDGALVPEGLLTLKPLWLNLFENVATVQFNHRLVAYLITIWVLVHAVRITQKADDERIRISAILLSVAVLVQVALGIWTLLAWVPLGLGVAHQAGALLLFAVATRHVVLVAHATRP